MSKLYAIVAYDKVGAMPMRLEKLKEHLTHTEANIDRLAIAGPLRDENGDICGSLLVVKAQDAVEARAILETDPYFKADIWSKIEIRAFGAAAGDWVGGKTW